MNLFSKISVVGVNIYGDLFDDGEEEKEKVPAPDPIFAALGSGITTRHSRLRERDPIAVHGKSRSTTLWLCGFVPWFARRW
jgi:hypothetical protein